VSEVSAGSANAPVAIHEERHEANVVTGERDAIDAGHGRSVTGVLRRALRDVASELEDPRSRRPAATTGAFASSAHVGRVVRARW
jgi:hypothetical protein